MCYVHAKSLQSCPTFSHHMDCSLPGSSVHEISKHEYWSALPCPLPGDLHNPGIKQCLLHLSPALQVDSLHLSHWEAQRSYTCSQTELRLKLNVTKEPRWWAGTCYKIWTALPQWIERDFPGSSDSKKSSCNAGDPGSIPGLERFPLEEEMATLSSILA